MTGGSLIYVIQIRTVSIKKSDCTFSLLLGACSSFVLTPDQWQSKTLLTMPNTDQKSIETVSSIAICRQSGDEWQSKTLFSSDF